MDFFQFSISVWVRTRVLKSWIFNIRSWTQIWSFDTPEKQNVFNFQLSCFSSIFAFILCLCTIVASVVKHGICNLFLSYCFLMLSSKTRFSNPVFQNSCSNSYFWGVKTRVSNFGFKTDNENPKLEKLNFWSTLIGPLCWKCI